MMPAISPTSEAQCFVCLESNKSEAFVNGPFCPNEGNSEGGTITTFLRLVEDTVYVDISIPGRHGAVHQSCLDKTLTMKNACPMCRLSGIRLVNQLPVPQLQSPSIVALQDLISVVEDARTQGNIPNLRDANLSGVSLRHANLQDADLSYADLSHADLSYADLSYTNLSYTNLSYANLSYADLGHADLSYSCLQAANLQDADLRLTRLLGVDFQGADLRYASLIGAELQDANFVDADLGNALLANPNDGGTDFEE